MAAAVVASAAVAVAATAAAVVAAPAAMYQSAAATPRGRIMHPRQDAIGSGRAGLHDLARAVLLSSKQASSTPAGGLGRLKSSRAGAYLVMLVCWLLHVPWVHAVVWHAIA